jgi:DNA-3-methyladenine glycosylase II
MGAGDASWRFRRTFTAKELRDATAHLRDADPKLGEVILKVGKLRLRGGMEPFQALIVSIIFQQLAGSAAEAILGRLKANYGKEFPGPEAILATPDQDLRACGLSRRKVEYLKDLSRRVVERSVNFDSFPSMSDEAIITRLDEVRGIGRWTAQMFLIFTLGRPDVLPTGDLGIRSAVRRLYGLKEMPTEKEVEGIGTPWHPHCSIASLYLWRLAEIEL